MFLLVGCIETAAVIGGGASNGKLVQSSLQSAASYGVKKATGKSPLDHTLSYVNKIKTPKQKGSCSSFIDKKNLETCLMVEKRIISQQAKIKEKKSSKQSSDKFASTLQPASLRPIEAVKPATAAPMYAGELSGTLIN